MRAAASRRLELIHDLGARRPEVGDPADMVAGG
jgi:hypothetical protein